MANNYLYATRESPFQSLVQGFTTGQGIISNIDQQNMMSIKRQMLQNELTKQEAVKNALANYGQEGFNATKAAELVMPHDPAMGIQLANLQRGINKEHVDAMASVAKLAETYGPMLLSNPQAYPQFKGMVDKIMPGNMLPGMETFADQQGNFNKDKYQGFVSMLIPDVRKEALKPQNPHFTGMTYGPNGEAYQNVIDPRTLKQGAIPLQGGQAPKTPVLWVDVKDPKNRVYMAPPQIPDNPNMVPHNEYTKFNVETMDEPAIDAAAIRYNMTGQLPPLGMGGAKEKSKILNRAAQLSKEGGQSSTDPVVNAIQSKAYQSELSQLQAQRGKIQAFEKTANENLNIALGLSQEVGRTAVPLLNKWIQSGQREISGDPKVSSFFAANRVAINEIAKITSSATGGAVTSDSARKEIEDLLKTAQTPEQYAAVIKTLQSDMQNRILGYDTQINNIKSGIQNLGGQKTNQSQNSQSQPAQENKAVPDRVKQLFQSGQVKQGQMIDGGDGYLYGINPSTGKPGRVKK